MKTFEVIYNTEAIRNCRYAFGAESLEKAREKAPKLISGEIIDVYGVDDLGTPIVDKFYLIDHLLAPIAEGSNVKDGKVIVDGKKVYIKKDHDHKVMEWAAYADETQKEKAGHIRNENGKAVLKADTVQRHAIVFEKLVRDNRPNLIELGKTEFLKSIDETDFAFEKTKDLWQALTFKNEKEAQGISELLEGRGYTVDVYSYGIPWDKV